ncbi:type 4a pilus biogenesis protein PilO [Candidatus Gracilibacteria bacterium]|jgi:Tfp pilus assembly protein PilO|nr:type 4a pilus biogenesis protein PilO [Candidatus Gracilibacteria bacterium]
MNNNRSGLILTLVALLVLVVTYVFLYMPTKSKGNDLEARLLDLRSELANVEELAPDQQSNLKIGEVDAKTLELAVPNVFDQDQLIESLSSLALKYSIKVDNLSFGKTQTENNYIDSTTISLSVTGGYNNFLQFLRDLESSDRFFNIQNFTLGISESEPREVNFSVNMEVYNS